MHRTITVSAPHDHAAQIAEQVSAMEGVVGVSHVRGASVKPPGDVVTLHVLNEAADEVLAALAPFQDKGPLSVATAELSSISDTEHQSAVDNDVDEAIWEELETGLRHQGRLTANFVSLMMLGGIVGAVGTFVEPSVALVAYVASAIIAPGFEPVAKLPLGIVLQRLDVVKSGLVSMIAGYLALSLAAAVTFLALSWLGAVEAKDFLDGDAVKHTRDPGITLLTITAAGALAGILIFSSYRRAVIAGPLIAMRLIEVAAVIGVAAALADFELVLVGLKRLAIDVAFVVAAGLLVFSLKQVFVHRRSPLR